jgi:hypothetical protein
MNFVVIAWPRTGSTRLTSLLNAQDNIACQGEIFHPKTIFLRWDKKDMSAEIMAELMELRQRDPTEFLDRIFAQNYGAAHVGFKLFDGQNDEVLWNLIDNGSVRKIVLLRSNFLAAYSSILQKRRRSQRQHAKVKFNPDRFLSYCDKKTKFCQTVFDRLNGNRQFFCVVHYEQINDPWFFARLVAFIGGDPSTLKMETSEATQRKPNASHIVSRFSNASSVEDFLSAHGLNHWRFESVISLNPLGSEHRPRPDTPPEEYRPGPE